MIETILVGIIVAGCVVFSGWRLVSVRLRLKILDALSVLPAAVGGNLVAQLRRKTLAKLSGGCAACQSATQTLNANVRSANRRPGAPRH